MYISPTLFNEGGPRDISMRAEVFRVKVSPIWKFLVVGARTLAQSRFVSVQLS
jgi:hypothetical protein